MDPNSLSSLDPKLRETYERVMGTATPASQQAPVAADSSTTPTTPAEATPTVSDPTPAASDPLTTTPAVDPLSALVAQSPLADEQQPVPVASPQDLPNMGTLNQPFTKPHGHAGLIKVFYVLGATVFFMIYIFFWIRIFNVKLPF